MLSLKQLQNVCMAYSGDAKQCRYLEQDDTDGSKWYCRKSRKEDRAKIDKKLSEVVADFKKRKIDPTKQGIPLGDNCTGYPFLKHIPQGYDQKP